MSRLSGLSLKVLRDGKVPVSQGPERWDTTKSLSCLSGSDTTEFLSPVFQGPVRWDTAKNPGGTLLKGRALKHLVSHLSGH